MESEKWGFVSMLLHLFINVLLLILGMCLLGLGLAEESTQLTALLTAESKVGGFAVVIGVILIVATTINCCFAIDGSSMFYYVYEGILVLLFITMVAILIAYGPSVQAKVENDIRISLEEMILHYTDESFNKTKMDAVQQTFQCCGIDVYNDWYSMAKIPAVPNSCCIKVGCDTSNLEQIHKVGCVINMMQSSASHLVKLSAIGITTTVFLPLQTILVASMLRCLRSDNV